MANNYTKNIIELHHYYICADGNIKGIEIFSRDFITIYGPFISYNSNTNILENIYNQLIYIPKNYIDKYAHQSVYDRTVQVLNSLMRI